MDTKTLSNKNTTVNRAVGGKHHRAHLLSELPSDVAQSFLAIETEGIQSSIAKHLHHLGILCAKDGRVAKVPLRTLA